MTMAAPSGDIWVRQCTTCGRADLREWFAVPEALPADDWVCQMCETGQWKIRDLRAMFLGRAVDMH